jgi:hypothetical protein
MKPLIVPLFLSVSLPVFSQAAPAIVENGQPRAEIVISTTPTRVQRVAAQEFQTNVEKISGAHLPIVTQPTGKAVKVFVGESAQNPVKAEGLKDGAYRIRSGEDWLSLVGDDSDFTPAPLTARNNADVPRLQAEWEKIVGGPYGVPNTGLYKNKLRISGEIGKPDGVITEKDEKLEIWGLDERGSFNAVTAFFSKLGARWYLPGELGEVMPSLKTIPLAKIDETVRPDFPLRQFNFRFNTAGEDIARWMMHLGTRNDDNVLIAHGMATMTNREAVFAKHPDWFAIYGGKPDFTPGDSKCQLCYSNDELFRETVRYARTLLDTYPLKTVSIMPPDGYSGICQCEKCKGKDSPERNQRGLLSDYVWDFVNRVAKEIAKTHPQAKVLNCAYGAYSLPPLKIDKLEPNVVVCIVGGRRPINKAGAKSEGEAAPEALRAAWAKKTDNPLMVFENYPLTDRGWYLPSFAVHALGDSVKATKGVSQGEDIWVSSARGLNEDYVGFNAFLIYFTARMYWGGQDADVDAMFREYCRLFYGPAEQEMLAFFTHCEQHWSAMEDDKAKADEALALFEKAKAKADAASVYGRRLALIDNYLKGMRMKSQQLGQKRGPVPVVRLVGDARGVVVDGKLDDEYWQKLNGSAAGKLRELETGREPVFGTSFKAGWQGDSVVLAIHCEGRPGEKPLNTATRHDDTALWHGDAVEIELATESHSYYQIAVSPSGQVVDLDRGAGRDRAFGWDSKAEVATQVADDHWDVEIRIPITQDENDPLHQVIGRKPTQSLPWHINICRQHVRENGSEYSALSPTGTASFHDVMSFAYFYAGRSHQFEADPTVTNYVLSFKAARSLPKAEAVAAFAALADGSRGKVTTRQRSEALKQAAVTACAVRDYARADEVAARIPIDAVKKTTVMNNLNAARKYTDVIRQFGGEDLARWPFWAAGEGYYARASAYAAAGEKAKAEADFRAALEWTSDKLLRLQIEKSAEANR